jgi:uncharacterized protein DUF1566/uncharacterized protein DUF4388
MDTDTILGILGSGGPELEILKENLEQLTGFLSLVDTVDKLSDMDRRVSEDGMSLYHAISKEKEMAVLEGTIRSFFGDPVKRAGEPLPEHLVDNLTVSNLGGVKSDQTLFLKKVGKSEVYAALFPWQRKVNVITVHMGLYNPVMPDDDYEKLEKLVTENITQRVSEEVESGLAGQVQGISLPSFLQMSEMEGSTCSLRICSGEKSGMLHLLNGNLIDAEYGDMKHKEAAYAIIAWDSPSIEILKAVGRTKNEINLPLMHMLMDSLRQKDQQEFEKDAPQKKSPQKPAPKKKLKMAEFEKEAPRDKPIEMPPRAEPGKVLSPVATAATPREKKTVEPVPAAPKPEEPEPPPETDTPRTVPAKETPGQKPVAEATIDDSLVQKDESIPLKRPKLERSASPAKPKKKFPMALVAGLVILVLCGAGFFVFRSMQGARISEYDRVLKKMAQLKDFEVSEKLLMDFIDTHEVGDDTARAEIKLQELWQQNEESNYQKTIDAVNNLPVDRSFEENAKALYSDFLEKYPQTQHKKDIELAVAEISGLSEDVIFSDLRNFSTKEYVKKIRAYENYLSLYPQGKYRDPVKKMFSETLGDAYSRFKSEVTVCERAATWDACLKICDDYLAVYSKYLDMSEAGRIRARIEIEKEYKDLKARTRGLASDAARPQYMAYMAKYPDSSNNEEIKKELKRFDQDAVAGQQWESLRKQVQRTDLSLQIRIDRLERYLSRNNDSPFVGEAREILENLERKADTQSTVQKQAIRSKQAEEQAKQEAEERYAVLMKRQAEKDRIDQEIQKARAGLNQTQGRFVATGDHAVVDNKTGLMWGLLDSRREIGECMDYPAAKRYVNELRYNGYDDWRLPSSAELAGIYKNQPYFPASGAGWYWTSERFAKGYSYIVNTVSAKQETIFKKITQDEEACGSVRAVRP